MLRMLVRNSSWLQVCQAAHKDRITHQDTPIQQFETGMPGVWGVDGAHWAFPMVMGMPSSRGYRKPG
jgi:hypothetical protein